MRHTFLRLFIITTAAILLVSGLSGCAGRPVVEFPAAQLPTDFDIVQR